MKAKLTKVLSLVLVVIMALSLMTGCSTSSSGKGTKTQDGNKVLFSYDGRDYWRMSMGKDDDGKDQTYEE